MKKFFDKNGLRDWKSSTHILLYLIFFGKWYDKTIERLWRENNC